MWLKKYFAVFDLNMAVNAPLFKQNYFGQSCKLLPPLPFMENIIILPTGAISPGEAESGSESGEVIYNGQCIANKDKSRL